MRNVVFVAPFPLEATLRFVRALRSLQQVRLLGVWQQAPSGPAGRYFDDVVRVADALDPQNLLEAVELLARRHGKIHRLVAVLEPLQEPVSMIRERLGIPGPDVETARRFRDKAHMKDVLRAGGIPCARHKLAHTSEEAAAFVREVGFPIVMKPPAGQAAKATWRLNDERELADALRTVHVAPDRPMLCEEFLRGHEFSFETITIDGAPRFHSISEYYPTPLDVIENDWIQWCVVLPRDISGSEFDGARALGVSVVKTLGLDTGMTHMEWFRRQDGSLAVGEIAARPPGAHIVRMMGIAHDADLYRGWARAVVDSAFDGPLERRWSTGCAFLRGAGRGRVAGVTGVDIAQREAGHLIVEAKLPVVGAPKSDSYEGDGWAIVRHPNTGVVRKVLRFLIETIQVHYA